MGVSSDTGCWVTLMISRTFCAARCSSMSRSESSGVTVRRVDDAFADLRVQKLHLQGDLLGPGLAAQLLQQAPRDADEPVDGLHHVHGDADRAGLVGDGAGDGLANPPGGVGGELEALAVLELLHGADEADVALLDQVEQAHAAADVLLGHADHQAQVGLGQVAAGGVGVLADLAPGASASCRLVGRDGLVDVLWRGRVILAACVQAPDGLQRLLRQDASLHGQLDLARCPGRVCGMLELVGHLAVRLAVDLKVDAHLADHLHRVVRCEGGAWAQNF